MDSNKATEIVSDILQDGITVDSFEFNGTFRYFNIVLSNDYIINVYNSTGGVGATRWELQKRGSGAKCGNIDRANIITPYIFDNKNESAEQKKLFGVNPDERVAFTNFVNRLYSLPYSHLINQSKESLLNYYNRMCDAAMESGDTNKPDTIVTEVVAAYYGIKNIMNTIGNESLLTTMFLSGLKIADGQCSYIKIYSTMCKFIKIKLICFLSKKCFTS